MVRMDIKLAIIAFLGIISAIPSIAQNTAWNTDSDHSTARFVLSSSKRPAAKINIGVAQVSGIVIGAADASAPSEFDLTVYPADQDTPDPRPEDRRGESDLQRSPGDTVIAFRSTVIKPIGQATVRVTGDLTVTYVERVATYDPSESYSGPTYGPPITHSERREVTFEFQQIHPDSVSRESAQVPARRV